MLGMLWKSWSGWFQVESTDAAIGLKKILLSKSKKKDEPILSSSGKKKLQKQKYSKLKKKLPISTQTGTTNLWCASIPPYSMTITILS